MAYVANTLADDDKDEQGKPDALPSLGGATPAANTIGASSAPQPMSGGAPAQQQKTPQQQKGTGFVNLSSWLDAGKGRDKAIMDTGATAKKTEQANFDTAAKPADDALRNNSVKKLSSSVSTQLDREAGVGGQSLQPNATTLSDVINQKYEGPETIDYTAGQGMTDLRNLGRTNTVADVLAKPEIDAGRYGAGLRSLDNVLFGADGASQNAIKNNAAGADALKASTDARQEGYVKNVADMRKHMEGTSAATRAELERLGKKYTGDVTQRAADANTTAIRDSQREDMVLDPSTGQYVAVPQGQTMGEWEGSAAGSATAGNVQTDDERKRFDALNKLMGFDAPKAEGQYQAGRRTTKDAPGDITTQKVSQEYQGQFEKGVGNLIDAANTRMGPQGAYNNEKMLGFLSRYTPEQRQEMVSTMINGIMQGRFGDKYASPAAMRHVLQMLTLLGDDKWDQHIKSGRLS
jgi:hypothetical protein